MKATIEELEDAAGDRAGITAEFIAESVKDDIHEQYAEREKQLTEDIMRELERRVVLSVLDRKWREHLYEMDYLQEGIGLRAMAQRDPLVEYQREGFDMFTAMMDGIKEESVGYLFNLEVQVEQQVEEVPVTDADVQDAPPSLVKQPEIRAKGLEAPKRADRLHFSAPSVDGEGGVVEGDFEGAGVSGTAGGSDDEPARPARSAARPPRAAGAARSSAQRPHGRPYDHRPGAGPPRPGPGPVIVERRVAYGPGARAASYGPGRPVSAPCRAVRARRGAAAAPRPRSPRHHLRAAPAGRAVAGTGVLVAGLQPEGDGADHAVVQRDHGGHFERPAGGRGRPGSGTRTGYVRGPAAASRRARRAAPTAAGTPRP